MTTADALSPAPSVGAVQFLGKEAAYWRLRIKGAALLVVTLGLYRFWFATDVRRFLWSNTEIGGETLEYTGLATELLGGFLLALAILVPLYTALAGVALALDTAERVTGLLTFTLLVLLGQFALYRARRYRLTRTVFRGVRFDQHGAAWRYALLALFWWIVVIATVGLAYPWQQASLERYKMRRTSYGDLPGSFEGAGWRLFLRGVPIWFLIVAPVIFAFVALGKMVDWNALNGAMTAGGKRLAVPAGSVDHRVVGLVVIAFCVSALAALLLYPLFRAITMRWWISGLRFGAVKVTSRLRIGKVYRIYLRFFLHILATMLVLVIAAFSIVAIGSMIFFFFGVQHGSAPAQLLGGAVTLIAYVVTMLTASTIYQVVVTFAMWRLGVETAELAGADALETVRAAGTASSALGEGLADALGVGGILVAMPVEITADMLLPPSEPPRGPAVYFDGTSSAKNNVVLEGNETGLLIVFADHGPRRVLDEWAYAELRRMSAPDGVLRLGRHGETLLARLEIRDAALAAAVEARAETLDRSGAAERRLRRRVVGLSIAAGVSLIATAIFGLPVLANRIIPFVPLAVESRLGQAVDKQIRPILDTQHLGPAFVCGAGPGEAAGRAALQDLVGKLGAVTLLRARLAVDVVRRSETNAMALPGGHIYVYQGLIDAAQTPDELAGVLAHEMGHVAHRDGTRAVLQTAGLSFLFGMMLGDFVGGGAVVIAARTVLRSSYSRRVETAADAFSVGLMERVGGDPRALGTLLARIVGDKENGDKSYGMKLLRDHPETKDRIAAINAMAVRPPTAPLLDPAAWSALKQICAPLPGKDAMPSPGGATLPQ